MHRVIFLYDNALYVYDFYKREDNKMIKVLILMPNLIGGGAEKVVLEVVRGLNEFSNDIKADICLVKNIIDYNIEDFNVNFHIHTLLNENEKLRFSLHKALTKLNKLARNYDIIIGGLELTPTYLSILSAKILKKKHIGWIHTNLPNYIKHLNHSTIHKIVAPIFYRFSDNLVFVSKEAKENFRKKILNLKKRMTVIYNPINVERIENLAKKAIVDNQYGEYFIFVGRPEYKKGVDILIKAYHEVLKEKPYIKTKLLIIGKSKEENFMKKMVNSLGLQNKVIFLGFKPNPYPYIKKAKFLVLPSRFEGFGLVITEAFALGKTVIASNCPSGPAEILKNGEYGLLTEPENIEALKKAILYFLDDKNRKSFEKKVKSRALDFDIKTIIRHWIHFIREVYYNES